MFRVIATMGFLFGFVVLVLGVAHIPTYILVGAQIQALEVVAEEESSREAQVNEAEEEVNRMKSIIDQLKTTEESSGVVPLIDEIDSLAPNQVALRSFTLNSDSKSGKLEEIQVQGVAQNREALAAFKNLLEASENFSQADIPISDLARESNLTFTVTISLVTPL